MFHSKEFEERVSNTPGSAVFPVDAGHWMTYGDSVNEIVEKVQEFIQTTDELH